MKSTKNNNNYHLNRFIEENELEEKAVALFCQLNEQMYKANSVDFPSLFDHFY